MTTSLHYYYYHYIVLLIISSNQAIKSNKIGKNSYKEPKNSQYIVHYKMVQYKYSARLLNHDWQLLPGKSERFTGNLAVPSQDSRNPKPIVLEIKMFPFYLVILFKWFDQLLKKHQKVQTGRKPKTYCARNWDFAWQQSFPSSWWPPLIN